MSEHPKTVTFLGRRYKVEVLTSRGGNPPIRLRERDYPGEFDMPWVAYLDCEHELAELAPQEIDGEGRTPQVAVSRVERQLFSKFAKLGKRLGWEVER